MTDLLSSTVQQGLYQTTNGETYIKDGFTMTKGNSNLDRPTEVLSFKGVFYEQIENSRLEEKRIRRVVISYFLEDNSLKIGEPMQRNSGIRQGKFLLRQQVPKNGAEREVFIMPMDLMVGSDIVVFGRSIQILDCDEFSRNFYKNVLNYEMPEAVEVEKDRFESEVLETFKMKDFYGKKSWVNNGRVKCQKQFYALDNKVLKIFLKALDNGMEYLMVYFLADDSIELAIHNIKNRCKDLHMTYLKRRTMPSNFMVELPGLHKESKFRFNIYKYK